LRQLVPESLESGEGGPSCSGLRPCHNDDAGRQYACARYLDADSRLADAALRLSDIRTSTTVTSAGESRSLAVEMMSSAYLSGGNSESTAVVTENVTSTTFVN
jgi:hypothetical protein